MKAHQRWLKLTFLIENKKQPPVSPFTKGDLMDSSFINKGDNANSPILRERTEIPMKSGAFKNPLQKETIKSPLTKGEGGREGVVNNGSSPYRVGKMRGKNS